MSRRAAGTCAALMAAAAAVLSSPALLAAPDETAELQSLLTAPVYAASKYQQSVADAPAAVTILTQGEIRAFGWRTLADILSAVRGVYQRYDRGYTYLGVRGIGRPGDYSSRVLLLIDGVRVNENIYDSLLTGREFSLDVELIERVEFIPGPGSAVHGANAVLGTINLVTRSAASLRGYQGNAVLDSQGGWKLGGSTSHEFGNGSLVLAASFEQRPGQTLHFPEFDSPQYPGGVARDLDEESAARLFLRYEQDAFSASAVMSRRSKSIPNAPYGLVFGDPAAVWVDGLGLLGFSWHPEKVDGEGWYAQTGLGRYTYSDKGRYEPDRLLTQYDNLGLWLHGELNRTQRIGNRQLLLAGVDVQRDMVQRITSRMLEPVPEPSTRLQTSGTRLGLYATDDVQLASQWHLGLGMRMDRDPHGDWTATPRLSLLWHPGSELVVKALYGEAFRDPNLYERAPNGAGSDWNVTLQREQMSSKELTADWSPTERLRLSASIYRNDISRMIDQVVEAGTGALVYSNVSAALARGVELESEYLGMGGWRVRSSVARQKTTAANGSVVSNSPQLLAKLHATARLFASPARAALELQGTGSRFTVTGAQLPFQLQTNVSFSWNPPDRPWSLALNVYNLFDRSLIDPTSTEHRSDRVEQDGRVVALRLYMTF